MQVFVVIDKLYLPLKVLKESHVSRCCFVACERSNVRN